MPPSQPQCERRRRGTGSIRRKEPGCSPCPRFKQTDGDVRTPPFPSFPPQAGRKSVSPQPSSTTYVLPPSNNSNRSGQIMPPLPQSTNALQTRNVTPTPDCQQSPQLQSSLLSIGAMSHSTSVDPDPVDVQVSNVHLLCHRHRYKLQERYLRPCLDDQEWRGH